MSDMYLLVEREIADTADHATKTTEHRVLMMRMHCAVTSTAT